MRFAENQSGNITVKLSHIITNILKILVFIEVFALPLVFLPFTSEYYEITKFFFLSLFVFISLILLFIRYSLRDEFTFYKTNYEGIFITLLIASAFSTIFSIDNVVSFFGYFGRGAETFFYFFSLIGFVYVLIHTIETEIETELLEFIFLLSSFLLSLLFFISRSRLFPTITLIHTANFSPIGSADQLSYFLLFPLFIGSSLLFITVGYKMNSAKAYAMAAFYFLISISFGLVIGMSASNILPFVLLAIFSILYTGLLYIPSKGKEFLWIMNCFFMIGVLVIAICSYFFTQKVSDLVVLAQNYGWHISLSTIFSSFSGFFFGSGPDTFYYDFLKYIPKDYYASSQAMIEFSKNASSFLQVLATEGVLGVSIRIILFIASLVISFRLVDKISDIYSKAIIIALCVCLSMYVTLFFLDISNISIDFIFFFSLGIVSLEMILNGQTTESTSLFHLQFVIEGYWDKKAKLFKSSIYAAFILLLFVCVGFSIYTYANLYAYHASTIATNVKDAYTYALSAYEHESFIDYYSTQLSQTGLQLAQVFLIQAGKSSGVVQTNDETAAVSLIQQSITKAEINEAQHPNNPVDINAKITMLQNVYTNLFQNPSYLAQAIAEARYLVSQYPYNITYQDELGQLFIEQKDYVQAIKIYQNIYSPSRPNDIAYNYAVALEKNNEYTHALSILEVLLPHLDKSSQLHELVTEKITSDLSHTP